MMKRILSKERQIRSILKIILLTTGFCSCSKHIPAVYEVVGMSLGNSNNTGQDPVDAATDSVPMKAYAIKMTLNEKMLKKTEGDAYENGFMNEDQLTLLNVISLYDFDSAHPANTSLNSCFLTGLGSAATLDAFVSNGKIGGGAYQDGNYTDSWSTTQYLYLMTPPALAGNQSFVVEIGLSDGRKMRDTVNVKLY